MPFIYRWLQDYHLQPGLVCFSSCLPNTSTWFCLGIIKCHSTTEFLIPTYPHIFCSYQLLHLSKNKFYFWRLWVGLLLVPQTPCLNALPGGSWGGWSALVENHLQLWLLGYSPHCPLVTVKNVKPRPQHSPLCVCVCLAADPQPVFCL